MEKRIDLEKRNRNPEKISELNLDNCKGSTSVEGLTDEFTNLRSLSLIGSGLTSLKGFPKLPRLRKLELSDNKISGGLQILKDCERLYILNLSGNRIKDLATLEDLKELQMLRVLDLFNNEVTTIEGYREKVFELLPQLVYLDGSDRKGKEFEESDEEDDDVEEEEEEDEVVQDSDSPVKQNGKFAASDEDDEEDGDEEEVEEEESEEEEVGLKDIYNDNLEDDDSDVYEEGEEEEDDNDISDDSALEAEGANNRSRLSANNSSGALDSTNNTEDGGDEEEEEEGDEEEDGEDEEGEEEEDEPEPTSGHPSLQVERAPYLTLTAKEDGESDSEMAHCGQIHSENTELLTS